MSVEAQIEGFLRQAQLTDKNRIKLAQTVNLNAVLITPKAQLNVIGIEHFTEIADMISGRSERIGVKLRLQPGVYFDQIVPYRDDLTIQIFVDTDEQRLVREFVAIPINDRDLRSEGGLASIGQLGNYDNVSLATYEFQLMDKAFAKLKNVQVSENLLMANPGDVLKLVMDKYTKKVDLSNASPYKGLYIHEPIDNKNKYNQVIIPEGTRLIDVPKYLQTHNEYGIYSKGLGVFYKQNYWWIYPLYNTNLADTHHRPIDILKVPQDKIPSLEYTFYKSDVSMSIIATGEAMHSDEADIRKQNQGVGKRVVMGTAVSGQTGYHYENGRAMITRADTLQEFKLSDRRNGDEYIPIDYNPTGNLCAPLSENAINEGEIVQVEWHNGDVAYLEPGHPVRYQYIGDDDNLIIRRGVLVGYRQDYLPINNGLNPDLKRTCVLSLFLKRQAKYKTEA